MAGGVEAEPEKAAIPETVDRAEASEEAALMEEASPAQGSERKGSSIPIVAESRVKPAREAGRGAVSKELIDCC